MQPRSLAGFLLAVRTPRHLFDHQLESLLTDLLGDAPAPCSVLVPPVGLSSMRPPEASLPVSKVAPWMVGGVRDFFEYLYSTFKRKHKIWSEHTPWDRYGEWHLFRAPPGEDKLSLSAHLSGQRCGPRVRWRCTSQPQERRGVCSFTNPISEPSTRTLFFQNLKPMQMLTINYDS